MSLSGTTSRRSSASSSIRNGHAEGTPSSPSPSTRTTLSSSISPTNINISNDNHDYVTCNNQNSTNNNSKPPVAIGGSASILRFLLLPRQAGIVLLLEFLNSFRSFGLRFVLYNYITNEYGITDTHAGKLLGIKGFVDIFFGLMGSILVDIVGVRRVSVFALGVAIVGRTLLAFGRTTETLFFALFLFSPCGDALLGVGLYRVALKKLTTPLTRPLAFAVSYAAANLAGALADVVVDKMRNGVQDLQLDESYGALSGVYTPIRQFIVVTWVFVVLTFLIAFCFLRDETVIDPDDLDENDSVSQTNHNDSGLDNSFDFNEDGNGNNNNEARIMSSTTIPHDAIPAKPMVSPRVLKRWFPKQFPMVHSPEDEDASQQQLQLQQVQYGGGADVDSPGRLTTLPNYKVYKTKYAGEDTIGHVAPVGRFGNPCNGIVKLIKQVIAILLLRNTWKVLLFGFASFTVVMQWTASEIVLPPFLERRYGEFIPIYTIQSINLFGCLILPPIVGAYTTGTEDFQIVMPGLWIMACSPIFIAMFPNILGACIWQVVLTVGEVLWSPRQDSWTAGLAPTGMEGLFFAIGSARSILGPLGDMIMGAMNEKYNTNCPSCRDQYGHFCQNLSDEEGTLQCSSVQESCDLILNADDYDGKPTCPKTCLECPTWEATDPSAFWYLLMLFSIISPLSVWFFLPFLRGHHARSDGCYGIFKLNKKRLLGVFGVKDDRKTSYDHVRAHESFESDVVDMSSGSTQAEIEFM